ncbi:hypothetical protein EJ07DRAFT_159225 [Lizonia empirigonia]|nr:hypothetical protein EJ07DRAFT_159225 [Lizonia empirigonia]
MDSYITEQKCLLPISAPAPESAPQRRTCVNRHHDLIESLALTLILFLASSQCLILYGIHSLPIHLHPAPSASSSPALPAVCASRSPRAYPQQHSFSSQHHTRHGQTASWHLGT